MLLSSWLFPPKIVCFIQGSFSKEQLFRYYWHKHFREKLKKRHKLIIICWERMNEDIKAVAVALKNIGWEDDVTGMCACLCVWAWYRSASWVSQMQWKDSSKLNDITSKFDKCSERTFENCMTSPLSLWPFSSAPQETKKKDPQTQFQLTICHHNPHLKWKFCCRPV